MISTNFYISEKKNVAKTTAESFFQWLFCLCFCFLIIYICLPFVKASLTGNFAKLLFVSIVVLMLVLGAIISGKWFLSFIRNLLIPSFVLVILISASLLFGRYNAENDFFSCLDIAYMFFFIGFGMLLQEINNLKINTCILIAFFLCMFITSATTIRALNIDSDYSRLISSSSTSATVSNSVKKMNVGGYDFIYTSVILDFFVFKYLFHGKNRLTKLLLFVYAVINLICVIKSNFTMALLFILFEFIAFLVPARYSKKRYLLVLMFYFLLALLLASYFIVPLLRIFDEYYSSIYMSEKIEGLISFFSGTGSLDEATSRIGLMKVSVGSFLSNPMFGVGIYYHDFSIVGGHSQVLDDLARYGLIGFMCIVYPGYCYFKKHILNAGYKSNYFVILLILFIAFSAINISMVYLLIMTIFTIVPIFIGFYNNGQTKNEKR
jgi:hypothetical protein